MILRNDILAPCIIKMLILNILVIKHSQVTCVSSSVLIVLITIDVVGKQLKLRRMPLACSE